MADIIKQQEIAKYEKFMHWLWKQKSITSMVLDLGMDGIAKKYVKESIKAKPPLNESVLPISDVNNLVCPTHGTKLYKHPDGMAYCSLCNYSIQWQTCC